MSPCSVKCTFPNALEFLNDKKQELKNYFNDRKEKQNERINFYFINKYGKINTKMFRELKPDKHRKKQRFGSGTWQDPDPLQSPLRIRNQIRIQIHFDFFPRIRIRIHLRKH